MIERCEFAVGLLSRILLAAVVFSGAGCGNGGSGDTDAGNVAFDYVGQWIQISADGSSTCGAKTNMEISDGFSGFVISKSGSMFVLAFKLQDGTPCMLNFAESAGQLVAQAGQTCSYMGNKVTFDAWTFTPSGTQLVGDFMTTVSYGGMPACTPYQFTWQATFVRT